MITPEYPRVLYVGSSGSSIEEYTAEDWSEIERDPRGLLLMWSPPKKGAKYVMGLDPTEGHTGWSRMARSTRDTKTDNAAIEVFHIEGEWELIYKEVDGKRVADIDPITKKARKLYRDVQVAEWAGPVDAVEAARIANIIGRIYAGDEEDQCLLIHEAWPGPGMLTTQELLQLGYGNLFQWQYLSSVAEDTKAIGWHSTRESQKLLWYRSRRHLMNRQALIRSKFLLDEYSNAEIDPDKMRAKASYGSHDDRMQAANMCFWGGHAWTTDMERTDEQVSEVIASDYQTYAPVLDDYESYPSWKARATESWEE